MKFNVQKHNHSFSSTLAKTLKINHSHHGHHASCDSCQPRTTARRRPLRECLHEPPRDVVALTLQPQCHRATPLREPPRRPTTLVVCVEPGYNADVVTLPKGTLTTAPTTNRHAWVSILILDVEPGRDQPATEMTQELPATEMDERRRGKRGGGLQFR